MVIVIVSDTTEILIKFLDKPRYKGGFTFATW